MEIIEKRGKLFLRRGYQILKSPISNKFTGGVAYSSIQIPDLD